MARDVGRPTVMTPEVLAKLEYVFALGGTDLEAIFYANISKDALYDYQNAHPEFTERKEALKQTPILKARETIIASLDQVQHAQWFAGRKLKKEFSERVEHTGDEGGAIVTTQVDPTNPLVMEYIQKLQEQLEKKA